MSKKGRIVLGDNSDGPEPPDNDQDMPGLPPLPALKMFVLDWFNAASNDYERREIHAHLVNFTDNGGINFVAYKVLPIEQAQMAAQHGAPPYVGRFVGCFPNYVFMEEIEIPEGRTN